MSPCVKIPNRVYIDLAIELHNRIADTDFFNGRIDLDVDEFHYQLTATLLVYRDGSRVRDIVPVWWEFNAMNADTRIETDFDWAELKEYLL